MKTTIRTSLLAGAMAGLMMLGATSFAQQPPGGGGQGGGGRGGNRPDPAEMQQRMMARYREALEIKADDEWKAVEPLITKINEARREVGFGGAGRMMFRGGGPGGGGGGAGAGGGGGGQAGGGGRGFGGPPSAEEEGLQKAVETKAPSADLKNALAKYRDARKAKEAKLTAAQDKLREVLSQRQEAQAVLVGLLN